MVTRKKEFKKGYDKVKIKYNYTIENILDMIRVIVYVGEEERVVHDFPVDIRNIDRLIEIATTEDI